MPSLTLPAARRAARAPGENPASCSSAAWTGAIVLMIAMRQRIGHLLIARATSQASAGSDADVLLETSHDQENRIRAGADRRG